MRTFDDRDACQDESFPWKCVPSNVGFKARFYSGGRNVIRLGLFLLYYITEMYNISQLI